MFGTVTKDFLDTRSEESRDLNFSMDYGSTWWDGMKASSTQQFFDYNTMGALEINRRLNLADMSPDQVEEFFAPDMFDAAWTPSEHDYTIPDEYLGDNPEATREDFEAKTHEGYSMKDLGIEYEDGHRKRYWNERAAIAYARKQRESIIASSELGTLSTLAAGFGAQIFDPVNFVPLGGVAAKVGLGGKGIMRAIGRGALEGGVGNFVADVAIVKPTLERIDQEMGWDEVAMDVAFGVAAGGIFGAGGNVLKRWRADKGLDTVNVDPDAAVRNKAASDLAAGDDVHITREIKDTVQSETFKETQDGYISQVADTPDRKAFRESLYTEFDKADVDEVVDVLDRIESTSVAKNTVDGHGVIFRAMSTPQGQQVIKEFIKDLPEIKRLAATGSVDEYVGKLTDHFLKKLAVVGDPDLVNINKWLYTNLDDPTNMYGVADEMIPDEVARAMNEGGPIPEKQRALAMDFTRYLNGEEIQIKHLAGAYAKMKYYAVNVTNALRKTGTPESPQVKAFFDRMDTELNTVKSPEPKTKAQKDRAAVEKATGEKEVYPDDEFAPEPETTTLLDMYAQARAKAASIREGQMAFQKEMADKLNEINKQILEAEQGNLIKPGDAKALRRFHQEIQAVSAHKINLINAISKAAFISDQVINNKVTTKQKLWQTMVGPGSIYKWEDISNMVDSIYRQIERNAYPGGGLRAALDDVGLQIHLEALEAYKTRATQHIKLAELEKFLDDFAAAHPDRSEAEALSAAMVGSARPIEGAMKSVDSIAKGKRAKYWGELTRELEEAGVLDMFRRGGDELELDVSRELWAIDENGKNTGATKNVEAQKIAEIVNKYQRSLVDELNGEGAFIRWLQGYVVRQSHDANKMRGMVSGRSINAKDGAYTKVMNKWREDIKQHLDMDKTFDDPSLTDKQKDKILEDIYVSIVTGKYFGGATGKTLDDVDTTLGGRLSQHRKLHFKSADDWYAYNKMYGSKKMFDSVIAGFDKGTQNLALMKVFGPDPETVFATIMGRLERKRVQSPNLDKDLGKNVFGSGSDVLSHQFDELSGKAHIVDSQQLASSASLLRMWQNTTSLGSAAISAIADTPLFMVHAHRMGMPIGKALKEFWIDNFTANAWMKTAKAAERQQVARSLGLGIEGMMSDFMSRFTTLESQSGTFSHKFHNTFFKATGLQAWTDSHKKGWGIMMSNHFTDLVQHDWATINNSKQFKDMGDMLRSYGFTEADWDVLRKTELADINGNKYMLPQNIEKLDQNVADLFRTFVVDSADTAIITPGAKERAFMHRGLRPGTYSGELARMMWQFKSFPLTLYSRVFRGLMQRGEVGGRGFGGQMSNFWHNKGAITSTAMLMTTFGGLVLSLKDITRGREPRVLGALDSPENTARFFAESLMAGGATGLLGDALFGLSQDYGTSTAAQFLGPVPGTFLEALKTFIADPLTGDFSGKSAVWFIKNNLPYANHFAIRGVMDYFGTYAALEAFNPGYLGKMENKYMRKYGTDYLAFPSDVYYDTYGK